MTDQRLPVRSRLALTAAVTVVIAAGVLAGWLVAAAFDHRQPPVVLERLIAPRGLSPLPDGDLLIAEGGAGRILRMDPDGRLSVVAEDLPHLLEAGPDSDSASGVSAAVFEDGAYHYVVGEARAKGHSELYRLVPGSRPVAVTGQDVLGTRVPKPINNPYDLVSSHGGAFLVTDAGLNALLRITPDGAITQFAVFPDQEVRTAEGVVRMQSVPTGLARGPDGALYMTTLTGFPYPRGAAAVYRIEDVDSDGRPLGVGEVSLYLTGLSAATDLTFDVDGSVLVTEFSTSMAELALDLSPARAAELPGRLIRARPGSPIETVAEGLVGPTSVTLLDGRIFVSEELAGRVTEIGPGRRSRLGPGGWTWSVLAGSAAVVLGSVMIRRWAAPRSRRN